MVIDVSKGVVRTGSTLKREGEVEVWRVTWIGEVRREDRFSNSQQFYVRGREKENENEKEKERS